MILKLIISGNVQGVWYRNSTMKEAQKLGLTGYAKNMEDGSVEVVAVGSEENLLQLKEWCHEGSPGSHVDGVEESWSESEENFNDFQIL